MKFTLSLFAGTIVALGAFSSKSVAEQPVAMFWTNDWRKMSKDECAAKAVEAMGIKENFIEAEIRRDGTILGTKENASALVFAVPIGDGIQIYIVVVGKEGKETERLREALRKHIFEGTYDPKVPAKIVTKDSKRRPTGPFLHMGAETLSMTQKEFSAAASTSMERQGMKSSLLLQGNVVFGTTASADAAAFYLPTKPAAGHVGVVTASFDSKEAERLRAVIQEDITEKKLPKPWAVILCKFSDEANNEPYPPSFYKECFTEAGAGKGNEFDYFRQVTAGALDMTGSKVFGWFDMPAHATKDLSTLKYPAGRRTLAEWGIDVAKANKIDLTPFHGTLVVFNSSTDSGSAGNHLVVLGYKGKEWNPTFNTHELGHGFDLGHTWSARPDVEYGDRWDIMSAMRVWTFPNKLGQASGPGMNAFDLKRVGAIPAGRIWDAESKPVSKTITLAALNQPEADGYLMASIPPAEKSTLKTSYIVEFRQKKGWDAGIPQDTILVHEVRPNGNCYLLSRTKNTEKEAVQVLPGQEFKIPERKLTIKALSFDAAASTAKVQITTVK